MTEQNYAVVKQVAGDYEETVARVRAALAGQGFGVLTEIDVAVTLKNKLGVEHPPMIILGACNPPLAHRALTAVPDISTLLPCNVVVRVREGHTEVAWINPLTMSQLIAHPEVAAVAEEADRRLHAALDPL